MTYEQIEAFIAIMTYGTITSASNFLHVSQSTVSARIQMLEDELGATLLIRHKGQRNVELTSYGQAFLPLASQWSSVFRDSRNLRTLADIQTLSVASVDAVNNYTFVPLFSKIIDSCPNIRLQIRTHHSDEIHGLISNRTADVGFVFSRSPYPDIISRPVYRELMYLICRKDSPYYAGERNIFTLGVRLPAMAQQILSAGTLPARQRKHRLNVTALPRRSDEMGDRSCLRSEGHCSPH